MRLHFFQTTSHGLRGRGISTSLISKRLSWWKELSTWRGVDRPVTGFCTSLVSIVLDVSPLLIVQARVVSVPETLRVCSGVTWTSGRAVERNGRAFLDVSTYPAEQLLLLLKNVGRREVSQRLETLGRAEGSVVASRNVRLASSCT